MKQPEAYCGVITVEQPFSISRVGIDFRGKPALEIKEEIGRENTLQIVQILNQSFQTGFSEGQSAMRKMQEKISYAQT